MANLRAQIPSGVYAIALTDLPYVLR
jgi:hypothetical protein